MVADADTLDDLREDKGVRFAGMGAGASALALPAFAALALCAFSYLVRWALARPEVRGITNIPDVVPEVLTLVGWWSGIIGLALLTFLIFLSFYPVRAITLWFPTNKNQHVRRTGLRAARRWKRFARASFLPVRSAKRERVYPGLRSAKVVGGKLALRLQLPADRVPGTREKWLDSAANELKAELRVRAVQVGKLQGRYATYFVTVRDLTEEARGVEL